MKLIFKYLATTKAATFAENSLVNKEQFVRAHERSTKVACDEPHLIGSSKHRHPYG